MPGWGTPATVKRGGAFRYRFVVVPLLLLFTPLWRLRKIEPYALKRFRCYLQHLGVWARRVFSCRAAFATIYTTLACPENRNICSQAFSLLFTACGRLGETGPRGGVPLLLLFTSLWRVRSSGASSPYFLILRTEERFFPRFLKFLHPLQGYSVCPLHIYIYIAGVDPNRLCLFVRHHKIAVKLFILRTVRTHFLSFFKFFHPVLVYSICPLHIYIYVYVAGVYPRRLRVFVRRMTAACGGPLGRENSSVGRIPGCSVLTT